MNICIYIPYTYTNTVTCDPPHTHKHNPQYTTCTLTYSRWIWPLAQYHQTSWCEAALGAERPPPAWR